MKTKKTDKKRVTFILRDLDAGEVHLSGSFNGWSRSADPMKRHPDGTWQKIKVLPRQRHEYKFLVDGIWKTDPACPESCPNRFGTRNSAIDLVRAGSAGERRGEW